MINYDEFCKKYKGKKHEEVYFGLFKECKSDINALSLFVGLQLIADIVILVVWCSL